MPHIVENSTPGDILSWILDRKPQKISGMKSKPKNRRTLIEIKLPKEGGILCYWEGMEYPTKGFPFREAQEKIDAVKKNLAAMLNGVREGMRHAPVRTSIALLFLRKQMILAFIDAMFKQLAYYELKPERYCQCVREMWRVSFERKGSLSKREYHYSKAIRRIVGMILEYDDAYRFRFQHIVGQLDQQKPLIKELIRLTRVGEDCEKIEKMKKIWRGARIFLWYLRFSPYLKKEVSLFFSRLNLEEIKLSAEDLYYAKMKVDYKWD